MSTLTIIVIVVAALIAIALLVAFARHRSAEREIEHDRLSSEAFAHRDQADSNVARAREVGREAEAERSEAERHAAVAEEHAQKADEHAQKASDLEKRVETAGRAAAFHDEQAAEREERIA